MSAVLFDTNALINICSENDVAKLEVFGSTARGEANDNSDVDLVVAFSKRKSLLALVRWKEKCRPHLAERWTCLPKLPSGLTCAKESNEICE